MTRLSILSSVARWLLSSPKSARLHFDDVVFPPRHSYRPTTFQTGHCGQHKYCQRPEIQDIARIRSQCHDLDMLSRTCLIKCNSAQVVTTRLFTTSLHVPRVVTSISKLVPGFRHQFSSTAGLRSDRPKASTVTMREFDPEIKDLANYVHNYQIKSDLAVRVYH